MNQKGQATVGIIIGLAITLLVGLVFMPTIAQHIGTTTDTISATNVTIDGTNATWINLPGKSWSGVVIYNHSNNAIVPSTNYTVRNNQVVNGEETARIYFNDSRGYYVGFDMNISGTYEPTTYIGSAGGRSIANVVLLLFAVAIAVVALIGVGKNRGIFNR